MAPSISWPPPSEDLLRISRDLTEADHPWPSPAIDSPLVSPAQLRRASQSWSRRARGAWFTLGETLGLTRSLLTLHPPAEVLSGATYAVDEIGRHLLLIRHISGSFHPPRTGGTVLPDEPTHPTLDHLFADTLRLFLFNLPLSRRVFDALQVITSDRAISEISGILARSTAELITFGQALLPWLHQSFSQPPKPIPLPGLLVSFERLFGGSPAILDDLAGRELTLEPEPGNLGFLSPIHEAALFYDSLSTEIFPSLQALSLPAEDAWHHHYQARPMPCAALGVGVLSA